MSDQEFAYGKNRFRGAQCPAVEVNRFESHEKPAERFVEFLDAYDVRCHPGAMGKVDESRAKTAWLDAISENEWSYEVRRWAKEIADDLGWT